MKIEISRKDYSLFGIISIILFVLILSIIRIYSANVLTSGAWDLPIFLDGAWRVIQGQIVHVDFSSPLGPVTFFVSALGIKLKGLQIQSLSYGVVVIFILVTIWFYFLSLRFMHWVLSLLSSILIGSFLITPRVLSYFPTSIGYVGQYNSIGYALLFVIGIVLFLKSKRENKFLDFFEGASLGVLSVILLFTKITFGVAAFILIGYRLIILHKGNTKKWLSGLFFGTILFLVLFFLYFEFKVEPFVRDMRIVAFSRSQSLDVLSYLEVFYKCLPSIFFIALASWLLFLKIIKMTRLELKYHMGILLIIILCGYFLTISISQPPEFSVSALCAFYLLSVSVNPFQTMKDFFKSFKRVQLTRIAFYIIVVFLIGKPVSMNLMGNGYAFYLKMFPPKDHYTLNSPSLSDAFLVKSQFKEFSELYNDGLELLSTAELKNEKILCVEIPNIFSFGIKQESPTGDLLYWHNRFTFNQNILAHFLYFKPEKIFQNVDVVMIPKKHVKIDTTKAFLTLYNNYLDKRFIKLRESSYWILYRKL